MRPGRENPAAAPGACFPGTLEHIPVTLGMSPSGAHTPLEAGTHPHALVACAIRADATQDLFPNSVVYKAIKVLRRSGNFERKQVSREHKTGLRPHSEGLAKAAE